MKTTAKYDCIQRRIDATKSAIELISKVHESHDDSVLSFSLTSEQQKQGRFIADHLNAASDALRVKLKGLRAEREVERCKDIPSDWVFDDIDNITLITPKKDHE